ncbi:MAG TPA: TIGR00289 family protein, partial [Aciduliprofundum sp.]|nr:TIGR00289 family protein [Aciduliprofundum sp.]
EGGEFETLVVGAPWFSGKIRIKDVEVSEEGPFTATLRVLEHEVVA